MDKKKIIISISIAVVVIACIVLGICLFAPSHEHSYGAWETRTPASCESAEVEVRKCECGEEETREGDPATGHTFVSISVESKLTDPAAGTEVQLSDLTVTGICGCGASVEITDGLRLEDGTLAAGDNTVTVRYGELSAAVAIHTASAGTEVRLEGVISDDTYVSSSNKDNDYSTRNEMGTNSSAFRIYFRVNISQILADEQFAADNAKAQLILHVTSGSVGEETTFTLKAYAPTAGMTDASFDQLNWNSVNNKEGAVGTYGALNWNNGTVLLSGGAGYQVLVDSEKITMTLAYSQIADFVDENGNIFFAFATNTKDLKVGSLENETKSHRPVFQVILSSEHFHVFDQEVAEESYLAAAAACGNKAQYYKSCSCGAAGTNTFGYGEMIPHAFDAISVESKLIAPREGMSVTANDLYVTGNCTQCSTSVEITDGFAIEGAKLAVGENTITVRYGDLVAAVVIHAEKTQQTTPTETVTVSGAVSEDTYVSSDKKDGEFSTKNELGTNSSSFRTYLRVNVNNILNHAQFAANNAQVKLILNVTSGSITEETTFTLKAYAPAAGVTDADFSALTWNSVNNKEGAVGTYGALNWGNGTVLASGGVGYYVSVEDGKITITLAYSQIADFVDTKGNILFAFGTNTKNLKIGSLENETESSRPVFQAVLNGEHIHVFDQEVAAQKHLATAATCSAKATYYYSCSCGENGGDTFEYGELIAHTYGEWETKTPATCESPETEVRKCKCGAEQTREGAEATGHSYVCEVAEEQYLATNNCGEQPTYYKSCVCGAKGTETFAYGEVNAHVYVPVVTAPTCVDKGYTTYTCACEASYVGDETAALGHDMQMQHDADGHWTKCSRCDEATEKSAHTDTLSAVSNIKNPVAAMVVQASDLTVAISCTECDKHVEVTAGIVLENATLVSGENTVTVRYGGLSTTVTIHVVELDLTLDGTVKDDTYVSSSSSTDKGKNFVAKTELNTYSDSFRTYLRVNISNVLNHEQFEASKDHAKVQLILNVTTGSLTDATVFTLKAYAPTAGVTDISFDQITWNSVNNKEGSVGDYSALNWGNGTELVSDTVGDQISVDNGKITITLDYSKIADFVDENGNILFVFATNTKSLKVGSIENETESSRPAFQVVLSGGHIHVFDQEVASEKYLATAATCTAQATYYKSCSCGEIGTDTFAYGNLAEHTAVSISAECTAQTLAEGMTLQASDFAVTAVCGCSASYTVTEGITVENATLVPGSNTVTVQYGDLSTTVTITVTQEPPTAVTVAGTIVDDTYIDSGNKEKDFSTSKTELNARVKNGNNFRSYFRFDFSDVLASGSFDASTAQVTFTFAVTAGTITEDTTFTFYTFDTDEATADVAFSALTWASVKDGDYTQLALNEDNGTAVKLVDKKTMSEAAVVYENGFITITVNYADIEKCLDDKGRGIFGLTTSSTDLKIASMENTDYAAPAVSVTYFE